LSLISVIALFVGGFLIFLTFSLAVAERTRLYGTLRALGAVPRQVRRVVIVEAVFLGLAASGVGVVLGYGLAAAGVVLAGVLGRVTQRLARGVGDIAVMHLAKERSRSAYTLALVMVVLAMILAVGASNLAMNHTLDQVLTREAGSDMQVSAPGAFEPGVADQLAAVDGIDRVSPVRFGQTY